MSDPKKSRQQLLEGITALRARLAEYKDAEAKHRSIEEQSRIILQTAMDGFCVIDTEGNFKQVNKAYCHITGYTRDELLSMNLRDIEALETIAQTAKHLDKIKKSGYEHFESRLKCKDGGSVDIEVSVNYMPYDSGQIFAVVRDVTARKRAEETLREREQRFRDIAENALEWIWEVDVNGKYTYASPVVEKILGYKPEEVLEKHFYDLFYPEDREELKKAAFEVFAKKQPFREFLNRNVHKNGKTIWLLTSGVPVLDEKGNFLGYRGADIDITERKRAEEALRQSEQDKALILGNLSELISYQDKSLKIVWANKAAGDSVGKSADELVGRYCYEIWHGRQEPCLDCPVSRSIESGQPQEGEITSPDGRIWHIRGCPVLNEQGDVVGAVETTLEITQRKQAEQALIESEQKHKALVENIPGMVYRAHLDWTAEIISGSKEICGYTPEELNSKEEHWLSVIHPDDRERVFEGGTGLIKEQKGIIQVYRIIAKSGENRWVKDHKTSLFSQEGQFIGIDGIVFDITERKRAEEELRIRDNAIESSISAIAISDSEGVLTYVNSAFLRIWGYGDIEKVVGRSAIEFWQHEDEAFGAMEVSWVEGSWRGELTGRSKDGSEFEVQVLANRVKGEAGKPDYMMASFVDITERKRAARALEYRSNLEKIIMNISRQFINLSSEQINEDVNQALKALGEFAEVDRSYIFQFFDEGRKANNTHEWCTEGITPQIDNLQNISVDTVPWWMDKLGRFENIHIPDVEKLPARAKNEKQILQAQSIQSLIAIPMVYNRQLIGFVGFDSVRRQRTWSEESIAMLTIVSEIFVNVLMRERIGQELAAHHEKMRRAEQLASLGTVGATIAHELNQPLTVMRLFLQQGLRTLKEDNDGDKVAEVIDDCLNELTKAASIVDRFRRFARKSAPVYIAKVNLVEVANGIVEILAGTARREKLNLSVTVESCPPYIIGNSLELEQIFFVLIQNAIQAADGETWRELAITISSRGDQVHLTFADTCSGIRKEDIEKIFEPFFTTKPANLGTGLGLCILERIVKRHGGSVRVESRIGHGTIFYICLPIKS